MLVQKIKDYLRNRNSENWHEAFILDLAKLLRPKNYVELGLYQCKLFNSIIPYADKLVGVDMSPKVGAFMKKGPKTEFYQKMTGEYFEEFKKNPFEIDMIFIDADHSAKSVMEDFRNFFPYVKDQ